jgi:RNA polymerase sigma-70 factor (ECF subfamily)
MMEAAASPFHAMPSGLCEDAGGEAAALIQRMAKGDGGALADLYGMWCPVLLGSACRMLGGRREAEEMLRETFERMWKHAADYDPHQEPPFVWAFVTMRGLAVKRLRGGRRGKRDSPRDSPIQSSVRCENPRVLGGDDSRRLRAAMDQLDLEERTCLELAVFLEYARPADSDSSGSPPATVKNRLRRAVETVRIHLSRHEL